MRLRLVETARTSCTEQICMYESIYIDLPTDMYLYLILYI